MSRRFIAATALLTLASTGCDTFSHSARTPKEIYLPGSTSVPFDVEHKPAISDVSGTWEAKCTSHNKTAHFRIVVDPPGSLEEYAVGRGSIFSEHNSDASGLLTDLQKVLRSKAPLPQVAKSSSLPFEYILLGQSQSQAPGGEGGFRDVPAGNWIILKIFVGDPDNEGELFLDLNPAIKKGQFALKDPDYGDVVLANLAKVL